MVHVKQQAQCLSSKCLLYVATIIIAFNILFNLYNKVRFIYPHYEETEA